jgi:predicted GNAT family acetyltransferase
MKLDITKNLERRRYETEVNGYTAFIEYIKAKNAIYLTHTEVPAQLGGQGVGKSMVKAVLTILKEEGQKVAPLCPFVAAYIKENREWVPLVADGYNVG